MLGNWSFGDYFKRSHQLGLGTFDRSLQNSKENLYVSVFEGNPAENVPFDQEAWDIWKELIDEDRIILETRKTTWEMGDQGPCGPCSEIHVDIRSAEEKALVSGRV
jgi:alanyl-tRNA synthetase